MDITTIQNRRAEVEQQIARYDKALADLKTELEELAVAERVLLRLSGAKRAELGAADKPDETPTTKAKPDGLPTVRAMILEAMGFAEQRGRKGMSPSEIRAYIQNRHWPDMPSSQVYSNVSRMVHETNDLVKDEESGCYRLAQKNQAPDVDAGEQSSGAFFNNPSMRPVKPEPGGGT